MLKRIVALLVIAVIMVTLAVACQGGADPEPAGPVNGAAEATPAPEQVQDPADTADNNDEDDDNAPQVSGEETSLLWQTIGNLQQRFPAGTSVGEGVGGILNFALVTANNLTGIHNPVFAILYDDSRVNDFMFTSLLNVYENNRYSFAGPAWFEYDRGEQVRNNDGEVIEVIRPATFTVHFHDSTRMYWWDGVEVTMYDVLFAYEMIAYPGTQSDRFGPSMNTSTVLGMEEYRADTSVGISGIRVFNNGRSIEFSYESIDPTIVIGGVWTQPMPRHHFEGIPMIDIPDHENSRSNPMGNGAFMFSHSVPGESVLLTANPTYWRGAPRLDGLNIEVITPPLLGEAMMIGRFDLAAFQLGAVPDYEDRLTNVTFVSTLDRRLDFMGFRHGFRNHDTGVITPNPDSYINCVYLRRAMGYARDDMTTTDVLFNGFRFPISTTIVPWQGDFMYEGIDGFMVFDLDKANQILDDAGYEWLPGEDFRRHNVTGEPFELVWLIANNFVENYDKVPHHQRNWAQVGLNVVLHENRLVTLAERSEILTNDLDNGSIHIYDATWMVGSNPNPNGLWGDSIHNSARYQSNRYNQILANINSEDAWDIDYLTEQFFDFQRYVYEHATWIPVSTSVLLWTANNRVLNYSLDRGVADQTLPGNGRWHLWDLSSDTPYSAR